MEQLIMQKRSTAPLAAMVAIVISLALVVGYLVYVNHSTISSLKSELSEKDQIITDKDNLIQEKEAIINQSTIDVQEKQKEVEELQQQVSLKLEQKKQEEAVRLAALQAKQTPKIVEVSAQAPSSGAISQFQDGWKATFYSLSFESCGKRPGDPGYGLTASGRRVQDGITIAVDPRYIPLGTWVELQFPDGHIEKRRADDTGSAIKGHKIDVYVNASESRLMQMGKQSIKVRILRGDTSV